MNRWRADWQRWRALSPAEQRLLLSLLCWRLPLVQLQLRTLGLQRCLATRGRAGQGRAAAARHGSIAPARLATLVELAARRGPWPCRCLPQALVLHDLLRSRGAAAQLRIGVLPGSVPLQAHAWVELDGEVLGKPTAGVFVPFSGALLS